MFSVTWLFCWLKSKKKKIHLKIHKYNRKWWEWKYISEFILYFSSRRQMPILTFQWISIRIFKIKKNKTKTKRKKSNQFLLDWLFDFLNRWIHQNHFRFCFPLLKTKIEINVEKISRSYNLIYSSIQTKRSGFFLRFFTARRRS